MASKVARHFANVRVIVALVLIIALAGVSVFAVMSDLSVHGLTVKASDVTRYCTVNASSHLNTVTFSISASVWSTSSLSTRISQVRFSLTVDGVFIGFSSGQDNSWDPGGRASYTLTFGNPALDPGSLPASSTLTLATTALVSAGLFSGNITATDTLQQAFGSVSC